MTEDQATSLLSKMDSVSTQLNALGTLVASISLYVTALALLVGVLIAVEIIEGHKK